MIEFPLAIALAARSAAETTTIATRKYHPLNYLSVALLQQINQNS
jgi:hypothetical protein